MTRGIPLFACMVRLGGLLTNTVPKEGVSAAEILVLQHIHGSDAVVDIIPQGVDEERRVDEEYDRLVAAYDRQAGGFVDAPGNDDGKSIIRSLFPGAVKRLPLTLEEIGLGHLEPEPEPEPAPTPRRRKAKPELAADEQPDPAKVEGGGDAEAEGAEGEGAEGEDNADGAEEAASDEQPA